MALPDLIAILAIVQYFFFSIAAGKARGRFNLPAPATAGNEMFERYYRVQMNTLETLVIFLPALFLAERYWNAYWTAAMGVVYLIGRIIYFFAYVKQPSSRTLGYVLTVTPTMVLVVADCKGIFVSIWLSYFAS